MPAYIHAIATAVPPITYPQAELAEKLCTILSLKSSSALRLKKIFKSAAIEKRHGILPDFSLEATSPTLWEDGDKAPTTFERNEIYKKYAPQLAQKAAKLAIAEWGGDPKAITHIISISCTGMMAPGIEFLLVDALGLPKTVQRFGINFMGCFGAFKGLSLAKSIACENPKNKVLIVCTELCSLHFQKELSADQFVINALFGDGSAAAIVGGCANSCENRLWEIEKTASFALEDSLDNMTWDAGDRGFVMKLSQLVPEQIKKNIKSFARSILKAIPFSDCSWALHPGGKAIVEAVETECDLNKKQTEATWQVLKNYGNMSSGTFLFVLDELRREKMQNKWTVGLGFGPGLSMEGILLKN